jgi:hypothetical protein
MQRAAHGQSAGIPLYTYEFDDQTAPFHFPKMPGFPLAGLPPTSNIRSRSGAADRRLKEGKSLGFSRASLDNLTAPLRQLRPPNTVALDRRNGNAKGQAIRDRVIDPSADRR